MNRKIEKAASVAAIVVIGFLFGPVLIADEFDDAYNKGYKRGYDEGFAKGQEAGGVKFNYDKVGFYYGGESDEWQPYEFVESTNKEILVQSGRPIEISTAIEKYNLNSNELKLYLDRVRNFTKNFPINHSNPQMKLFVLPDTTDE